MAATLVERRIRITFIEQVLGTASGNPELHREYIASKSPDPETIEDEVAALGVDGVEKKDMTIFPRTEDGKPFIYDYQIKGFLKNACKAMREVKDSESAKLKAYKTKIDNLVFIDASKDGDLPDRRIIFENPEGKKVEIGNLQRPLRAQTMQGERICLANSETIPAGTQIEFTLILYTKAVADCADEWLNYGRLNGIGQWHNSGCGRFIWEEIK